MGSQSKRANWYNGEKLRHGRPGKERWEKLLKRKNLSPEFKRQIQRNIIMLGTESASDKQTRIKELSKS